MGKHAAVERFGGLDVVANVAGYGNLGSIADTGVEDFRAQIDTNLLGPIYLSKDAIPTMRAQRSGHILNFSSVGGRIGSTGRAPYSAAKFGIEGFSEAMVTEMAPLGIKVTIFEPGGFRTVPDHPLWTRCNTCVGAVNKILCGLKGSTQHLREV